MTHTNPSVTTNVAHELLEFLDKAKEQIPASKGHEIVNNTILTIITQAEDTFEKVSYYSILEIISQRFEMLKIAIQNLDDDNIMEEVANNHIANIDRVLGVLNKPAAKHSEWNSAVFNSNLRLSIASVAPLISPKYKKLKLEDIEVLKSELKKIITELTGPNGSNDWFDQIIINGARSMLCALDVFPFFGSLGIFKELQKLSSEVEVVARQIDSTDVKLKDKIGYVVGILCTLYTILDMPMTVNDKIEYYGNGANYFLHEFQERQSAILKLQDNREGVKLIPEFSAIIREEE